MGIKHFVFAVNKMDLVYYDKNVYDKIARDIKKFVSEFDIESNRMIPVSDREEDTAQAGQPVTIQLDWEIDISRGCVLCKKSRAEEISGCENTPLSVEPANMVTAKLFWMDDDILVAGRNYWVKVGTKMLPASVMNIKYKIDVNSGDQLPAEQIYKNELAVCDIMLSEKCAVSAFDRNKNLGSFILSTE